jgi:putative peptidoglycan lipid II flippase
VVLLPQLSAAQAKGEDERYSDMLDWGLRLVLMLSLPCAVALLVFPLPLVSVLYHYGHFTERDAQQTVMALMGYGVGLVGLVSIKVLAPGFYAKQDIATPVRIAVTVLGLTQLLNLVLVPRLGHAGLALSIGLAALVNAGWLLVGLRRRGSFKPAPGWGLFMLRVAMASALMGVWLAWMGQRVDWMALGQQPGWRVLMLALALSAAGLVYFAVLWVCGVRPRQFMRQG